LSGNAAVEPTPLADVAGEAALDPGAAVVAALDPEAAVVAAAVGVEAVEDFPVLGDEQAVTVRMAQVAEIATPLQFRREARNKRCVIDTSPCSNRDRRPRAAG